MTALPFTRGLLRRVAVAGVSTAALALAGLSAPPAAVAQSTPPAPSDADRGLFGDSDPTYDGVWRQSVALLAQDAVGYAPADRAVEWLLGQQCDDGSFLAYRADVTKPCGDVTAADTNATGLAVQALVALGGHEQAVDAALTWLRGVQNEDGGWAYNPGGASDANSTAIVVGALVAAGQNPAEVVRDGATPYDALSGLQLGCEAGEELRGAFAWQPDPETGELFANDAATVDALLAAYGSGLLVDAERAAEAGSSAATPPPCDGDEPAEGGESGGSAGSGEDGDASGGDAVDPAAVAAAGAAYLGAVLGDNEEHLVTLTGEGAEVPDHGATARAVIALAAGGRSDAAAGPLAWLQENLGSWQGYGESPAALGTLILAVRAAGAAPEDFGGADLVTALGALGPTADDAVPGDGEGADASDGGAGALPWIVGGVVVAAAVVAAVVLVRRRTAGDDGGDRVDGGDRDGADGRGGEAA
ncbi:prenyltransferase/squalene oxidase repeat-containing protein [Streptomyces sp. 4N509B]|uniref:prenyltransferase/squalene oxidase repeat-containing protein n=1 Tax=Streptomyces sp. 4N509B TaxID=3457413 RepID=UPI003FD5F95E